VLHFSRDRALYKHLDPVENLMTARGGVEKFARDIVTACRNAIMSWNFESKYLKLVLVSMALMAIGIVGWVGQNWYLARQAMAAQKSYAHCTQLLHDAQESDAREGWMQVDRVAKAEYSKHSRSSLAPYFKLVESNALHQLGDHVGAIDAARQAADIVSAGTPLVGQLRLRAILMQLDSQDEAVHTHALQELEKFAADQHAADRDVALYMLGRYHWARGEVDEAANIWRELAQAYQTEDGFSSAWAQDAARLLEYVPQ